MIHRYHKATQELWKFCFRGGSGAYLETVAATLEHLTAEGKTKRAERNGTDHSPTTRLMRRERSRPRLGLPLMRPLGYRLATAIPNQARVPSSLTAWSR